MPVGGGAHGGPGSLDDDGVGGLEVFGDSVRKLGEGDASGMEDDILAGVDGSGDEIELVDVEGDKAVGDIFRHS